MSTLHIFNPSHDEALAANTPYYYPTKAARTLAADLCVLPAWWAKPGDYILIPIEVALPPADFCPNGVHFVHPSDLKKGVVEQFTAVAPWGWDDLLIHQLKQAGVPASLLPSAEKMSVIRQLSSRHTAVLLLKSLRADLPNSVGESFWATTEEEVWNIAANYPAVMLKAPWSCSGRGVFSAQPDAPESIRKRVARILREQGAIEVEPLYERVSDFALEFYANEQTVHYTGLSAFVTTAIGAYAGNKIDEEEILLQQLPQEIREQLLATIESMERHLQHLLHNQYQGPLGIDLMCVRNDDGQLALHPCVEINLRNTMGQVALACRKYLPAGHSGIYRLQPLADKSKDTLCLTPFAQQMEAVLIPDHQTAS